MPYSFELTPKQEQLQQQVREFTQKYAAPVAAEVDETDNIPRDLIKIIRSPPYQYTAAWIPKKYGGLELERLEICILMEEIAYVSLPIATLIEVSGVTTLPIVFGGSEELKQKYLTLHAKGEIFSAFSLTEEGAGSDANTIKTQAEKSGDEYILNGQKRLVSMAEFADIYIIFARTDPTKKRHSISAFVVEKKFPGFKIGKKRVCYGVKGHQTYDLILEDCRVPVENCIGEEGHGFKYALRTFDDTRPTLACGYIGLARAALDIALQFAKTRETFGKPLIEHEAIKFPVVEIATEIECARLLAYKACWLADQKQWHKKEASMAKYYAAELAVKAAMSAMKILGGFGSTKDYPIERFLRDATTFTVAQGSPEIQRLVVARELLKDSKEKSAP
jgi:alkylation response protein AidB-like acyl-CoA dehydrogenase